MVVEEGLRPLSGELRREAGGLLPTELVVVFAAHLVVPSVAVRHREGHPVLRQHLLERLTINRAGVHERSGDLVAEHLLEAARGKRLTAQFPVRLRLLGIRQHRETFIPHQLVVQLVKPVLPGRVPLEAPAGEVVVVDHKDVCVRVTPCRVLVDGDHVVGGVHALGQLDSHVANSV